MTANSEFRPEELKELNDIADNMIEVIVRPLKNEKRSELRTYDGFIENVYQYSDEFDEELQDAVDEDMDIELRMI